MDKFFLEIVKRRELVITLFKVLYVVLIAITFIGGRSLYLGDDALVFFYDLGKKAGEAAIVIYILTMLPGIFRRFGKNNKLVALLMIFRRYIGITMYLLVFMHFWMMRGVEWFLLNQFTLSLPLFELIGIMAHSLLLLLALTSNDISTKKLGVWWGRIHSLTYLIMVLIFLHVALREINIWSLLIGTAVLLQVLSYIYKRQKQGI